MTKLPTNCGVSITQHFKRQLENFCREERISKDEARELGKSIIEQVRKAHGGNMIFSSAGCKVPVSIKLENGGNANMQIVFDEVNPECRALLKIRCAEVVRQGQE